MAPASSTPSPPNRILLFSHPRSASNLLVRMLSLPLQSSIYTANALGGYQFVDVSKKTRDLNVFAKPMREWDAETTAKLEAVVEKSQRDMRETMRRAEEVGKVLFDKEHVQTILRLECQDDFAFGREFRRENGSGTLGVYHPLNDTYLTDTELRTFTPVLLIRHPAKSFYSFQRVDHSVDMGKEMPTEYAEGQERWINIFLTMRWTRRLAEWYDLQHERPSKLTNGAANGETTTNGTATPCPSPIILDADDLIASTETILPKLAARLGLDASKFQYTWKIEAEEERKGRSAMQRQMLSTLLDSTGVLPEKVAGKVDLDHEEEKWKGEFGEETAARLRRRVEDAIADYEFLRARRLR
jgi:hypothetical protein